MIDLTSDQAAPRIASLLAAHESRTLDFKRASGKMVGNCPTVPSAIWLTSSRRRRASNRIYYLPRWITNLNKHEIS
jgi:hypothetical protein